MSSKYETPAGKAGACSDLLGSASQSSSSSDATQAQFPMLELPPPLQPFAQYRQFVIWKLVPSARAGKMDKLPSDWRSGTVTNAHDQATWGTFEECADAVRSGRGDGVGFVFTDHDPFWFLDIDGALMADNKWSPLGYDLIKRLPGCAVEVSQSGRGLHIFGTGTIPDHSCKNVAYGLELYHTGRFVALTGLCNPEAFETTSVATAATDALVQIVAQYFPPGAVTDNGPDEWTDEPVPEWDGPVDDDDLIRRALASGSRSAAKAFGGDTAGVTFPDLWERNVDALSAKWPSPTDGDFDASSADMALAAHLAFWTGKNPERIRTLMYRSALVRDKWDARGDYYLPRTILRACGLSEDVAKGSSGPMADHLPDGVSSNDFYAYMPAHTYIFGPTGEQWPASSINARLSSNGFKASDWLDRNRPVEQMTWVPGQPQVVADKLLSDGGWITRPGCNTFNLYRPPVDMEGDAGKAEPWVKHLQFVYPEDWKHIVNWLAHRVQRPDEKINHALVLGGSQGVGKDTILEPVKAAVGPWNFSDVGPGHLLGRFNGFVKSVILRVSEARDLGDTDRFKFYEHMKTYTASPPDVLRVDEKNKGEYSVVNVCGVIVTTNHKLDGIYLPPDDRRHYVAWSGLDRDAFPKDYWNLLYEFYNKGGKEHVVAYLRQLDLSEFDAKAPPRQTNAFWEIVTANHAPEDAELSSALDSLGRPDAVTLSDIVTAEPTSELASFLRDRRNSRRVPHRMEQCGYSGVRNPGTKAGRWRIAGKDVVIYARSELAICDRMSAAESLATSRRTA